MTTNPQRKKLMNTDQKIILTKERAIALIGKRKQIHTFVNPGAGLMMGCDHSRKSILKDIEDAEQIEIGGQSYKNMGHGLVIWQKGKNRPLFVEVDKIELENLENELSK